MIYKVDKDNYTHDVWENDWYICPNCGFDSLDIGFNYCPECGESLSFNLLDDEEENAIK